ncbi:MAG: S41 family peptidase [Vulcanibacillus sp.]
MRKIWKHHKKKLLILTLAVAIIFSIPYVSKATDYTQHQLDILAEIYSLIKEYHISGVDYDTLTKGAINGMIESLEDPHTKYFTEEEYQEFIGDIDGSFTGIGIYIQEKDDYIGVQSPIIGSPAEAAGLKAGDLITHVDGISIKGKSTEEAADLIRGKEGTTVQITFIRNAEEFTVEVVRASIQLPSTEADMLTEDTGYLRIYTFSSQVDNDVAADLAMLKEKGMENLILDLRGNPGGYLNAALNVSSLFIENGPIVYVKDNLGNEQELAISNGVNWDLPLIVLIDGGSASASEILAGALKDYNKATIVGENSYGKGTVQNLISLDNGGYLKLTVNEYFTPNKNKMNEVGIKPDVIVADAEKQITTALLILEGNNSYKEYMPVINSSWIQKSGQDYIALREMINYFDGNIIYSSKQKTIKILLGNEQINLQIDASNGLIIENGKSYISLEQLNLLFKELLIINDKQTLSIFYP